MQGMAEARLLLGGVYRLQGDTTHSMELLNEALRNARDMGTAPVAAECMEALATLALDRDDFERAATLFGAVDRVREEFGWSRTPRSAQTYDDALTRLSRTMDEQRLARSVGAGAAMPPGEAVTFALESQP
jgi:Tfp pilus assembly protein PilF